MKLMLQQMEADIRSDPARTSESVHRTATVLLKQIDALARIAGDFANFARLPVRERKPVDVGALVKHVTDLCGGAKAQGIDVVADLPDDLPTVRGDEEELRRVLVNLVNNALEAVRGPGRVTVRARTVTRGGHMGVAVEVEDTGIGIDPEHLARLFEPDFSTKTRGTGLGLAIVKRILDDLGGTIEVESAVGRGSAFRMWWPCEPPEAAEPRGDASPR
jgi:signal transduction histidine kinase